jgi:DNA-binding NarL/FixJ family response regulator
MSSSSPIYVLIITPSEVIASGIESAIEHSGEISVCATIQDLSLLNNSLLCSLQVDAVLVDPIIFDINSRGNSRNLLKELIDVPTLLMINMVLDEQTINQYDDKFSIYDNSHTIIEKIKALVSENSTQSQSKTDSGNELSVREQEILISVAQGMLNKEIADKYNISIHTVISHRKNITRKTGIKTVAGLTVYALLNNLIDTKSLDL